MNKPFEITPQKRRNNSTVFSAPKEKRTSICNTDSDLLIRYIEKLNDVVNENQSLTEKLKEKELLIDKISKNPNKHLKILNCINCEKLRFEIEDLLIRYHIIKKKNFNLTIQNVSNYQTIIHKKNEFENCFEIYHFDFVYSSNFKTYLDIIKSNQIINFNIEIQELSLNSSFIK